MNIILFSEGKYEIFNENNEDVLIERINAMHPSNRIRKAEVAYFREPCSENMAGRIFQLYSDGRYTEDKHSSSKLTEICVESEQVMMAWQYNIPIGTPVYFIPEDRYGFVTERIPDNVGILYIVKDQNGDTFSAYDTALELLNVTCKGMSKDMNAVILSYCAESKSWDVLLENGGVMSIPEIQIGDRKIRNWLKRSTGITL